MIPAIVKSKFREILRGTVLKRIWFQVVAMAVYTFIVCLLYTQLPFLNGLDLRLGITNILGIILGVFLMSKTYISYNNYSQGRHIWASMGNSLQTLARHIWISTKVYDAADLIEKRTALNLLCAFPFATKHYLRNEYLQDYEDTKPFLSSFPEIFRKHPKDQFNPQTTNIKLGNELAIIKDEVPDFVAVSNGPKLILFYLGAYLDRISDRQMANPNVGKIMQDCENALGTYLCRFEELLKFSMPLAFSRHLEDCLHLYVLALPFQLVFDLRWLTVPIVALASFVIFGIWGIGAEIENPFGYGDNSLPLDENCNNILKEIRLIMSLSLPKQEDWMISGQNYPCPFPETNENKRTSIQMNAVDFLERLTLDEIRTYFRKESNRNIILPFENNIAKTLEELKIESNRDGQIGLEKQNTLNSTKYT